MLTIDVSAEDMKRAERLMAAFPNRLLEALKKANRRSSGVLVRRIKREKLTGNPLRRITGTLIRSWAAIMPIRDGFGWKGGAGSNLSYAAYHEFGFTGDVSVRAHERRSRTGTEHTVKAHTRAVKYAGRPYARPALRECRGTIREIHAEEIRAAAAEK